VFWPVMSEIPGQPLAVAEQGDRSIEDSAANDASVVLAVQTGGVRLLALGDLETAAQRELTQRADLAGQVDVVKVSHHGSARQDPALYGRLRPKAALIGVGPNSYGHPAPSTLAMLQRLGVVVLRTDRMGDVALLGGPDGLAAQTRP
jgi:competence protein ComEC